MSAASLRGLQREESMRKLSLLMVMGVLSTLPVQAQTWEEQQRNRQREAEWRQQNAQQQQPSPQVLRAERWRREWAQQHPGQPVPNDGVLQKLHRNEILQDIRTSGAQMRANRQAELRQNYLASRSFQQRKLDSQGIRWSPQQWANRDARYRNEQIQRARDYEEARRQAGEIQQMQEDERRRREIYHAIGQLPLLTLALAHDRVQGLARSYCTGHFMSTPSLWAAWRGQ